MENLYKYNHFFSISAVQDLGIDDNTEFKCKIFIFHFFFSFTSLEDINFPLLFSRSLIFKFNRDSEGFQRF